MCHKILANIYSTNFLKDSNFHSEQKSQSLLSYSKLLALHRLELLLFFSTCINRLLPIYGCYVKLIRFDLRHHTTATYIRVKLHNTFHTQFVCMFMISIPDFIFLVPVFHELSSWHQKLKKLFTWLSCYYFTFYKQLPQHIQHIFVSSINTHHFGLIN